MKSKRRRWRNRGRKKANASARLGVDFISDYIRRESWSDVLFPAIEAKP